MSVLKPRILNRGWWRLGRNDTRDDAPALAWSRAPSALTLVFQPYQNCGSAGGMFVIMRHAETASAPMKSHLRVLQCRLSVRRGLSLTIVEG